GRTWGRGNARTPPHRCPDAWRGGDRSFVRRGNRVATMDPAVAPRGGHHGVRRLPGVQPPQEALAPAPVDRRRALPLLRPRTGGQLAGGPRLEARRRGGLGPSRPRPV